MSTEEISLGEHFFAEKRGEKEYAILHKNGGLHMADICEVAMIESIASLQAQVDALAVALQNALPYINADVNERGGPVALVVSALAAVGR